MVRIRPADPVHSMEDFPIRTDIRNDLTRPSNHHWIQHRVLSFDWQAANPPSNAGIRLCVHDPNNATYTSTARPLKRFISDHLNYAMPAGQCVPGSWNIEFPDLDSTVAGNETRVLIIQLDNARDWEFTEGKAGVRAKEDLLNEDCSLYFVTRSGSIHGPGGVAPENCCMVFWSVIGRPDKKARDFNFYISLIDADSGRKMPAVFDPSIPDNGGSSIP